MKRERQGYVKVGQGGEGGKTLLKSMARKTKNGRPAQIGSIYFEEYDDGRRVMKFCVGYCPECQTKIGLTRQELNELSYLLPTGWQIFISRLLRARFVLPR